MQGSETTVLVCIPQMAEAMKEVARLCPSIRRMIVIGSAEGFVSISDMFQDSGDFFDDNIEVSVVSKITEGAYSDRCFYIDRHEKRDVLYAVFKVCWWWNIISFELLNTFISYL